MMQGNKEVESKLHKKFKLVHGEWYDGHDNNLIEYINNNSELDLFVDWIDGRLMPLKKMKIIS